MSILPEPNGERSEPPQPIPLHRRRLRLVSPPVPLTPVLGRDAEVAAASALLVRDEFRLVTLVGPGGIGKTRLALEIASVSAAAFDDQVAWAPVVTATTPETVAAALAQAVGVSDPGSGPTIEAVKSALRDARLLMVVDNFEQVLDAAPLLTDLLLACPMVSLLVTSRAVLRISGERPLEVPPLATVPLSTGSAAASDAAPAVQLFAQRAAGVLPSFALSPEARPVVEDICRHLDGWPLAIELAAARINHLPLADLRDRLDRRLALLTSATRGVPHRHRTMRDAIAWSYDLLTPEQQALFRSLAVFVGGFTLDAAVAVSRGVEEVEESRSTSPELLDSGVPSGPPRLLDSLGALVDNSLVRLESPFEVEARYTMFETVREFAIEQLAASVDDAPRRRHAEYYVGLAMRTERTFWGDEPGDLRGLIWLEAGNLRAAMSRAIEYGEAETALRLARAIFDPQAHTGDNAREQQMWLRRALALPGGSAATRVRSLIRLAALVGIDDLSAAVALAEEALALARRHDDDFGVAESSRILGMLETNTGDTARARQLLIEALADFRTLGVRGHVGWTLHHLSVLDGIGAEADLQSAAGYCEEALAIFRDLEHVRGVEAILNWQAELAYKLGDLPRSLASAQEALTVIRSDAWSSDYLDRIADVAAQIGWPDVAARLYGAADEQRERAGRRIEPAFIDEHLGKIDVARQALGETAFAAAYAAGHALTQRQAEAEALAVRLEPAATHSTISLSPRELEVLRLLAAGLSDLAIAEVLFIGERTVNTHVARIFAKLGVRNRTAATTAAMAAGLIKAESAETGP